MKALLGVALILLATLVAAQKTSYTGYKLYNVTFSNQKLLKLIEKWEDLDPEFDVWNLDKNDDGQWSAQIMLSPKAQEKYLRLFKQRTSQIKVVSENVQDMIDFEERSMEHHDGKSPRSILNKYARHQEIINYIAETVEKYPEIASSYSAGKTHGGRDLTVLKLTQGGQEVIWIDCGIHAREWVTPATCVYIIDQMVNGFKTDPDVIGLLDRYEFHILPVYNPDGYEYTFTNTRLWRKNRSPNSGSTCVGTDLNRNCNYRWLQGGSSTNPCSDTFAGRSGNSELETQAVTAALTALKDRLAAYYSVHSYGNYWLLPWGHSSTDIPLNNNDLLEVGNVGKDAIFAVHGEKYRVGSSSGLLYVTTGSSADWAYGVLNVPYSFTLELRPGPESPENGSQFTFPEARLYLVTEETWAGVRESLKRIAEKTKN